LQSRPPWSQAEYLFEREIVMKRKLSLCVVFAAVLFVGCIPSLNQVYTDEQVVFDEDLVGVFVDPKSQHRWEFTKRSDESYHLVLKEKDGKQGKFVVHLADLDGLRIMDLFPEQQESQASGFYQAHSIPIHTTYAVKQIKPQLILSTLDFKWLETYLRRNPDELNLATFGHGKKVITSSTLDYQEFVEKHKDQFKQDVTLDKQD
jgi:hypothetical protein